MCVYSWGMYAYLCYFSGHKMLCRMFSFTFQTLNLLRVEKCSYPICPTIIVHQTLTCGLTTIGRFELMDNNSNAAAY